MILIGFILITSVFFVFAGVAGNTGHFLNLDSALILLGVVMIYSIFTFKWKELVHGLRTMVLFRIGNHKKDHKTASHYKSLMIVTIAVGVISTAQGLISYALAVRDSAEWVNTMSLMEVSCYASFTTVYALILSFLLFYPVFLLNRE